jgi:hypothetical protein
VVSSTFTLQGCIPTLQCNEILMLGTCRRRAHLIQGSVALVQGIMGTLTMQSWCFRR